MVPIDDELPEGDSLARPAVPARPSPHRQRPQELWHPGLGLAAEISEPQHPEERLGASEFVDELTVARTMGPFHASTIVAAPRPDDPPVDVVSGADLLDGPADEVGAPGPDAGSGSQTPDAGPVADGSEASDKVDAGQDAETDSATSDKAPLLPPFPYPLDAAAIDGRDEARAARRRLIDGPVTRRASSRPTRRRSLFGGQPNAD